MATPVPERIFHIATAADWRRAIETGTYRTSTVGRTLEEEGFIHASRREQVQGVFDRYYRGLGEDLVLLAIDPGRLESEVRVEAVGEDAYPHVYGPINRRAVIDVVPLDKRGRPETIMSLWVKGMARRMGIAVAVMAFVAVVVLVVRHAGWDEVQAAFLPPFLSTFFTETLTSLRFLTV